MRFRATARVKSRMACGNQAGAKAAWREFAEWMERQDRKDLTRPGHSDRPSPLYRPPQRRGIDTERPGGVRPAFAFHDHAPGIGELIRREFCGTAHMPPASTCRRHDRLCAFNGFSN
jgi:hypothetical protein